MAVLSIRGLEVERGCVCLAFHGVNARDDDVESIEVDDIGEGRLSSGILMRGISMSYFFDKILSGCSEYIFDRL